MVNYTTTTLNREGTLTDGDVTYGVTVTAINGELIRLGCSIMKNISTQPLHVGSISLEHGRQITEIAQGENLIPYLTKFQEILDEVLGKSLDANNVEKATKK